MGLSLFRENMHMRAHYEDYHGIFKIQAKLKEHLLSSPGRPAVVLCIGTDRSTGDSLGPLTGTKLSQRHIPGLNILGTLDSPIHAENLVETLAKVTELYGDPYIIALDACLGRLDSIGYITLEDGPLKPGSAVKKKLPAVGDIHLTGIVNVNGFMEYMVLQNTRLDIVWKLSDSLCSIMAKTFLSLQ